MEVTPALREQIVQAVLAQLTAGQQQTVDASRPLLLVSGKCPQLFSELEKNWCVRHLEECDEVPYEEAEALLASGLLLNELCQVANGMDHPLIQMRLRGKTAIICREGMAYNRFDSTMPVALGRRYREYIRAIESYGITILTKNEIVNRLVGPDTAEPAQKCVLTAAKITEMIRCGKHGICLAPGSVVTPLGKDVAKQQGFLIAQEESGCRFVR